MRIGHFTFRTPSLQDREQAPRWLPARTRVRRGVVTRTFTRRELDCSQRREVECGGHFGHLIPLRGRSVPGCVRWGTMLNQLMLRLEYRSDDVVIGRDLYEKCLPLSARFDRAVGFFASSVFAVCPEAFHRFFEGRGRMRVVCCPVLDRLDVDAIFRGYRERPDVIRAPQLEVLTKGRREVLQKRAPLTSWLVATGTVDVRIARRDPEYGNHIYHEKLGLF